MQYIRNIFLNNMNKNFPVQGRLPISFSKTSFIRIDKDDISKFVNIVHSNVLQ